MHDPGHSGRGSIVVEVVVVNCCCGLGLGLDIVVAALVLSQQTDPLLQFDVCGIKTDGLSQNAAMIFNKQKPGHLGPGSLVIGRGGLEVLLTIGFSESSLSYIYIHNR